MVVIGLAGVLFYAASCAVLHFGVLSGLEAEQRRYRKLRGIGITAQEAAAQMRRPLRILFFLPHMFSVLISGFFYIYMFSLEVRGSRATGLVVLSALIVSMMLLLLQLVFYLLYARRYTQGMLKMVQLL
ncbi:hypothetical protein C2I18_02270 [Paenibacillus sp. PK3_47]|uniref:hypothetical protein n=1 Tax=Paenibacillus sp. PK3_47 TaxID=2072642 RepID=UPI00201D7A46|nr:hypothetical protein [Paenibacillus sp. PK3_47]UQZ32480.1 hypothetical protein C2I18_02270 [Paenibacillus sp. PK3_47]